MTAPNQPAPNQPAQGDSPEAAPGVEPLCADRVPQREHAAVECPLLQQFEVKPHVRRVERGPFTHGDGAHVHVQLVGKARPERVRSERRPVDGEIQFGGRLKGANGVGVKRALDAVRALATSARVVE